MTMALVSSWTSTHAQDVITLVTNTPVGQTIEFTINSDSEDVVIDGATGTYASYELVSYVVNKPEITITSAGKLLSFSANDCAISQIDLSAAPNLTTCRLDQNELAQLDVAQNVSLTTLYCQYNNLSTLDVSNLAALKYLACSYNNLCELDVTNNTDLRELYCFNNQIKTLDVSALKRLGKLSCAENQIESLNLSNAGINLTSLFCAGNKIQSLDLSSNSWLTYLGCSENQIQSIDLSKNTDLQIIFLQNNPLNHQVDLTPLTKLEEVYVGNSGQTTIDVSKNPKLTTLSCSSNAIEELDITNNPKIRFLYVQDNQFSGSKMSALIEALPTMTPERPGQIIVKDAEKEDKNVCYVSDVEVATGKNWLVGQYLNNQYVSFDGDVDSGVSQVLAASTMCSLSQEGLTVCYAAPYASVMVYDMNGRLVAQAMTNEHGSLNLPLRTDGRYFVVKVAHSGGFKVAL